MVLDGVNLLMRYFQTNSYMMIQLNTLPQQKYSKLAEESIEIYIRKVTTDLSFQIHRLAIEKL